MAYPYAYPYGAPAAADPTAVMGRRIGAFFIDAALVLVVVVASFIAFHDEQSLGDALRSGRCELSDDFDSRLDDEDPGDLVVCDGLYFRIDDEVWSPEAPTYWLVNLGFLLGYFWLLGGLAGQTLGKLLTGIKAVKAEGGSPGLGRGMLRWLFFWVDGPLSAYVCGLITSLVSRGHRRVGDMVANTYVVRAAHQGPVLVPDSQGPAPGFAPHWDPSRGTWLQWDAPSNRWLAWNQAYNRWEPL